MDEKPKPPVCPHCGREMQLNAVSSNDHRKQFLCGCRGIVYHQNVYEIQRPARKA